MSDNPSDMVSADSEVYRVDLVKSLIAPEMASIAVNLKDDVEGCFLSRDLLKITLVIAV